MSQNFTHPFGKVAKSYRKFRAELPEVVSNIALNDFVGNFKRQGYVNKNGVHISWKPTKTKKRRTLGRRSKGILIQSGKLVRSMRTAATFNEARVVSNLPYAKPHNEGFKGTVRVKRHKRNRYKKKSDKYTTRSGKERSKTVNQKVSDGIVSSHTRKVNIERRPFMTTSKTIMDEAEKYAFKELEKIWKKS